MTTNDVFSFATKAMAHFDDVPWGGEVYDIDASRYGSVMLGLDSEQAAQALLSWLYVIPGAQLIHQHSGDTVIATVLGQWHGMRTRLHAAFDDLDAIMLCCRKDDHAGDSLMVHRLRQVQMRQTAALAGAE